MKFITTDQWDEALWQKARTVYLEAFEGHGGKPEKIIRNMFANHLCHLHVLVEEEFVAAMALTGSVEGSDILLIDYLAVRKDLRKKGIGEELLNYIKDWALSLRIYDSILIEVESEKNPENLARIHFWEKCGFILADDYTHHYIWLPEPYQAMLLLLHQNSKRSLNGKELFKHIVAFHKKSFKRN